MVRLTLEVTAGDLDGNYDVQWYVGSVGDTSTPITDGVTTINNSTISITPATSVDGSQQSVISNLPEGTYWAQVNDNMTGNLGCTVSAQGTVNENFTDVTLDLAAVSAAATDKSHCSATGTNDNGTITINFADITSGSGASIADYTIEFDGVATNTNDGTLTPAATPFVINNLAPDTYNIVITDETTGCVSQNYQVTIGQDGVEPDINVTKTNDNFCTGGNATITLDAVAPPDGDEADFNFDWYNGTNSSGATFQDGAGVNSATNLAAGDYTIVITALGTADDGIDCETTVQVNITDDPYSLAVNATGTDLDDCTPDDGIITINSLDLTSVEDGTSNPAINDADVTYEIFSDAALTTSVASTTGDAATSFTGLAPGTYYLTATYNGTSAIAPGCASPAVQIILDDNSNSPTHYHHRISSEHRL